LAGFPVSILFVSSAKHENREFWAEFKGFDNCRPIFPVMFPCSQESTAKPEPEGLAQEAKN